MIKNKNKSKTFLATYPVSIILFFGLILGFNLFLQNSAGESEVEFEQMKFITEYRQKMEAENQEILKEGNQAEREFGNFKISTDSQNSHYSQKQNKIQSTLTKPNDPLVRAIYQPTRKNNSVDLLMKNPHSAIILDVDSGSVLYSKNSTEKRSIASLTKLVTAMIVIDQVRNLDEEVIIPESVMSIEGTKVGCITSTICQHERLYAGEKVKVRDLLSAMLMLSANDAATTLALHISGSEEEFAKLMNARMQELGMTNTNFCRPSGLELDENEEACYSTAYDISRAIAHLLRYEKYDLIWDILQTQEKTFSALDGSVTHELKTTNRILEEFPNIVGGKTGFTPRAGYSLAMAVESLDKKHRIISIVLNDYHRFDDVQKMSNWAFDNYEWK